LPIESHSRDLLTFTPLCHAEAHFYEFGDRMATAETHEQSVEKKIEGHYNKLSW
jgi:hypothetical protein